jgi:hypothetical protein
MSATSPTASAVRASDVRGDADEERGGNPSHIAFQRRPNRLPDEVVKGKPATPRAPLR